METSRQAVEKNLSEIAFASVADKIPALMNYYLGFDLVEKNDSGTRAAGIMGFKIGKQLVYIPVFFLNGKLKGTEVMYLKNSDIFVTNTEQWVNYIIGQEQGNMGESSDEQKSMDGGEVSQALSLFSRPPSTASKTASIEDYSLVDVEDFIDKDLLTNTPQMNLVDFIKKAGKDNFSKIAEFISSPRVWKCVTRFYSPEDLKIKFEEEQKEAQEVEESKKLAIIRASDWENEKVASDLTTEEKTELFQKGYIIKNAAKGESATKMYIDDEKDSFQEVTESGLYKILNSAGQLAEAYVFVAPIPIDNVRTSSGSTSKIIVSKKNKKFRDTTSSVFYRSERENKKVTEKTDKEQVFSEGGSINSLSVGNTYMIIGEDMSAYGPFTVEDKVKESGKVTAIVRQSYCSCGGGYSPVKIRNLDLEVRRLDRAGDTVYVPKFFKFLEVKECRYDDKDINIKPGSFSTVVDALSCKGGLKAIFERKDKDITAVIEGKSASFRDRGDLVFYLCNELDLPLQSSEKIASKLETTQRPFNVVFMPKVAYPDLPDPATQGGATRGGTPQEVAASQDAQAMESQGRVQPATDPEFGTWDQPTEEDLSLLERAANSESREVFDPAMLGIIVRTSRAQSMVQEYIPEFVDNLDRMIRLLLLFYWHNAEFAEAYGIDQMADFEDLLMSTIKNTGKTILFLKQKAVESSTGTSDIF